MLERLSQVQAAALGAVALAACSLGTAHAEAPRHGGLAPIMTLGDAAAPPIGFLDLCQRQRDACATPGTDVPDLASLRAAALRRFWSDAFARRKTAPAAAPAETRFDWSQVFRSPQALPPSSATLIAGPITIEVPSTTVADDLAAPALSAVGTASFAMAAGDVGADAIDTQAAAMEMSAAAAGDMIEAATAAIGAATPVETAAVATYGKTFDLDRAGWRLVNGVNRRVNRAIRQSSDDRLYGVEDFWALPTAGRGDCEDFVLAKRAALIAGGVPAEALSIAIVITRWGESHAVLLIASDQGEFVLDSLSPWVSRWDRVDYVWTERQRPGQPFDWAYAAI